MSDNDADAGEAPDAAAVVAQIARLQRVVASACDPRVRDAAMIELREKEALLQGFRARPF